MNIEEVKLEINDFVRRIKYNITASKLKTVGQKPKQKTSPK